jgi:hypothetical protein
MRKPLDIRTALDVRKTMFAAASSGSPLLNPLTPASIAQLNALGRFYIDQSGGTITTYGALAGARDGVNTTFTVSQGQYITGSLFVYMNGQLQSQGVMEDWHETTPNSGMFDFTVAPSATDVLIAIYGCIPVSTIPVAAPAAMSYINLETYVGWTMPPAHIGWDALSAIGGSALTWVPASNTVINILEDGLYHFEFQTQVQTSTSGLSSSKASLVITGGFPGIPIDIKGQLQQFLPVGAVSLINTLPFSGAVPVKAGTTASILLAASTNADYITPAYLSIVKLSDL